MADRVLVELHDATGAKVDSFTRRRPWAVVHAELRCPLTCDDQLGPQTTVILRAATRGEPWPWPAVATVPDDRHWTSVASDVRALLDRGER